jgi:hypothetical protein
MRNEAGLEVEKRANFTATPIKLSPHPTAGGPLYIPTKLKGG